MLGLLEGNFDGCCRCAWGARRVGVDPWLGGRVMSLLDEFDGGPDVVVSGCG